MKYLTKLSLWATSMMLVFIISCGSDEEVIPTPDFESRLTSSERLLKRPASEISNLLGVAALDVPLDKIVYDVTMHKVEYTTTYKGQEITVSGMVFLPLEEVVGEAFPVLSWQHDSGTF